MKRLVSCLVLLLVIPALFGCAAGTAKKPASAHSQAQAPVEAGAFTISLGQVKTVYLDREGSHYKILRVREGEFKDANSVVFDYSQVTDMGPRPMQILKVVSRLPSPFMTYDCYQILGDTMRKTSILGALQNVPTMETWTDGVRSLKIENIRDAT
ncbi:MAG: hypothetical protein P8Z49_08315 [Acidobacteriota bacterium]